MTPPAISTRLTDAVDDVAERSCISWLLPVASASDALLERFTCLADCAADAAYQAAAKRVGDGVADLCAGVGAATASSSEIWLAESRPVDHQACGGDRRSSLLGVDLGVNVAVSAAHTGRGGLGDRIFHLPRSRAAVRWDCSRATASAIGQQFKLMALTGHGLVSSTQDRCRPRALFSARRCVWFLGRRLFAAFGFAFFFFLDDWHGGGAGGSSQGMRFNSPRHFLPRPHDSRDQLVGENKPAFRDIFIVSNYVGIPRRPWCHREQPPPHRLRHTSHAAGNRLRPSWATPSRPSP